MSNKRWPHNHLGGDRTFSGVVELSRTIHIDRSGKLLFGKQMSHGDKLTFVYDADGSIGVVMEFSESDFEAYAMPDLVLVGAFQTKVQAAQALGARTHQLRH